MKTIKKFISIIIIFIILAQNIAVIIPSISYGVENEPATQNEPVASSGFSGGDGSANNPWEIATVSDLLFFAQKVNSGTNYSGKYIKLVNDLDLSVIDNWQPIGNTNSMTTGSKVFSGNFDGNRKVIENCTIKVSSANKNSIYLIGFFQLLKNATVHDLELRNMTIELTNGFTETNLVTDYIAGGLCAKIIEDSYIYNCKVTDFKYRENNRITKLGGKMYAIGGIAGGTALINGKYPTIENCSVLDIDIQTEIKQGDATSFRQNLVGGIIGRMRYYDVMPENCVVSGNLMSNGLVGPIVAGVRVSCGEADYSIISGVGMEEPTNCYYHDVTINQTKATGPSAVHNLRVDSNSNYDPFGVEIQTEEEFLSALENLNGFKDGKYGNWWSKGTTLGMEIIDMKANYERENNGLDCIISMINLDPQKQTQIENEWYLDGVLVAQNVMQYEVLSDGIEKTLKIVARDSASCRYWEKEISVGVPKFMLDNINYLESDFTDIYSFRVDDYIPANPEDLEYVYTLTNLNTNEVQMRTNNDGTIVVNRRVANQKLSVFARIYYIRDEERLYHDLEPVEIDVPAHDLYLNVKIGNEIVIASLAGDATLFIQDIPFIYTWYELVGSKYIKIEGESTNILTNLTDGATYKVVAEREGTDAFTVEKEFIYDDLDHNNVIYVKYSGGNDSNNGLSPETAVKTMQRAYQILQQIGSSNVNENYVVVIGTYSNNDYGSSTDDVTFSVPSIVTGKYGDDDYQGALYFYGSDDKLLVYKKLLEDTKFEHIKLDGRGNGLTLYCQTHNLTMGDGIVNTNYSMRSIGDVGLPTFASQPAFDIVGGYFDYDEPDNYGFVGRTCIITIKSGTYGRVMRRRKK